MTQSNPIDSLRARCEEEYANRPRTIKEVVDILLEMIEQNVNWRDRAREEGETDCAEMHDNTVQDLIEVLERIVGGCYVFPEEEGRDFPPWAKLIRYNDI